MAVEFLSANKDYCTQTGEANKKPVRVAFESTYLSASQRNSLVMNSQEVIIVRIIFEAAGV